MIDTLVHIAEFLALGVVFFGLSVLWGNYRDKHGARASLEHAVLLDRDGGLLVTDEDLGLQIAGWSDPTPGGRRLRVRRLRDGALLTTVVGTDRLRLYGAAGVGCGAVWCGDETTPVHTRDGLTLAVLADAAAQVRDGRLKQLGGGDDPVYDTRTRGVHAWLDDGRGVLLTPDGQSRPYERTRVARGPDAERFVPGPLRAYDTLGPKAVLHFREAGALAYTTPDGATRWEVPIDVRALERGTHVFVTPDVVLWVMGSDTVRPQPSHWRNHEARDANDTLIALDAATGRELWRATV